jgi:hypothetical protein
MYSQSSPRHRGLTLGATVIFQRPDIVSGSAESLGIRGETASSPLGSARAAFISKNRAFVSASLRLLRISFKLFIECKIRMITTRASLAGDESSGTQIEYNNSLSVQIETPIIHHICSSGQSFSTCLIT